MKEIDEDKRGQATLKNSGESTQNKITNTK
jgi:hypothetical protein